MSEPIKPVTAETPANIIPPQPAAKAAPVTAAPAAKPTPTGVHSGVVKDAAQTEAQGAFVSKTLAEVDPMAFDDMAIIMDASIVARPLVADDVLKVRCKDPHYAYRWINWKSLGGQNYQKMLSAGFLPVDPSEVLSKHAEVHIIDGRVKIGDLMLMKIDRVTYAGFIKHNYNQSIQSTSHAGAMRSAMEKGTGQLRQDVPGAPLEYLKDKVRLYEPNPAELAEMSAKK